MTENKKKYAYWMRPTMVAEIEKMILEALLNLKVILYAKQLISILAI